MRPTSSSSSSPDLPCPRATGKKRARIQAACPPGTVPRLPSTWPVPQTQVAAAGDTLVPSVTRLPGYAHSSPLSHFREGPLRPSVSPPHPARLAPGCSHLQQGPHSLLPVSHHHLRTSVHWVVPLRFWVTLYLNHPPKDLIPLHLSYPKAQPAPHPAPSSKRPSSDPEL